MTTSSTDGAARQAASELLSDMAPHSVNEGPPKFRLQYAIIRCAAARAFPQPALPVAAAAAATPAAPRRPGTQPCASR
jgi:hypothetical protein